jgi:thioesterase domain-containing protein
VRCRTVYLANIFLELISITFSRPDNLCFLGLLRKQALLQTAGITSLARHLRFSVKFGGRFMSGLSRFTLSLGFRSLLRNSGSLARSAGFSRRLGSGLLDAASRDSGSKHPRQYRSHGSVLWFRFARRCRVSCRMMSERRRRETEEFLHRQIPLTKAMQVALEADDERGLVLSAPLAANHNHLGSAFGGSLSAIMMLAGYALLWLELENPSAHLVLGKCQIEFRRPVRGRIRATCLRPATRVLDDFRKNFARKGKARIDLEVVVEDGAQIAVSFAGRYVALTA